MKQYAMLASVLILAAGCGSKSPAAPSGPSNTVTFTAALSAANENPPITNADTSARGTARVTLNLTRDGAGAITGATADFSFDLTGFPAGTTIILAHVHEGAPGITGPARINSGLSPANTVTLVNGSQSNLSYTNLTVPSGIAQQMIDNPNGFYFNVHSAINTGGAVRAPLVKQ